MSDNDEEARRHAHATVAGLEDALAVAGELVDRLAITLEYARQRTERIREILRAVRKDPHNYDPDNPSGKRFIVKKR